jgi:hypothetical protein
VIPMASDVPILYVEGKDDISVVSALLLRHGLDTRRGKEHLFIKDLESVDELLKAMPDAVKAARSLPVGFVVDIDIACSQRWQAVQARLNFASDPTTKLETPLPAACPPGGYFGKVKDYPHRFGVWLMPDCQSDGKMLEDLAPTLMTQGDPLWAHAESASLEAAKLVDAANRQIPEHDRKWKRYSNQLRMKASVHTWLAWQREPGIEFGAAINAHVLRHDSDQAKGFLRWLRDLYDLPGLAHI